MINKTYCEGKTRWHISWWSRWTSWSWLLTQDTCLFWCKSLPTFRIVTFWVVPLRVVISGFIQSFRHCSTAGLSSRERIWQRCVVRIVVSVCICESAFVWLLVCLHISVSLYIGLSRRTVWTARRASLRLYNSSYTNWNISDDSGRTSRPKNIIFIAWQFLLIRRWGWLWIRRQDSSMWLWFPTFADVLLSAAMRIGILPGKLC